MSEETDVDAAQGLARPMDAPSRGSAVSLLALFALRIGCVRRPNNVVHHAQPVDPRLGERFGVGTRWVGLAGTFVRTIERFGSLALPS
jgi:hypothetical protein